jgi:hypothetical protein
MRRSSLPFVLLLCSLAVAACSGSATSSGGKASVAGTAGGKPVPATDVVAIVETADGGAAPVAVAIAITNLAGACGVLERGGNPANVTNLNFLFVSATPLHPGSYPIGAPSNGTSQYSETNAMCGTSLVEDATTGSVTLTGVSASLLEGTFDVTMGNGDHLTGTFSAPVCGANLTGSTGAAACGS